MSCTGLSSFVIDWSPQILTSMLSVVGYIKPWWWVEGATGASGTTSLSIPQGVTIWKEHKLTISLSYAWFTEVVLAHKWRSSVVISAFSNTGARWLRKVPPFIKTSNKTPDVLVGRAMCDANSIKIESVDQMWTIEYIWSSYLATTSIICAVTVVLKASVTHLAAIHFSLIFSSIFFFFFQLRQRNKVYTSLFSFKQCRNSISKQIFR